MGRSNCSIIVNGSWWRPTISIPNIRSEGARSTGAAMIAVSRRASADTEATSAARAVIRHHCCQKKQRPGERPGAHVAHLRHETAVAGHTVEHREDGDLRKREHRQ